MAQILDLGKLRFNWAGSYSGTTEYSFNDIVKYGPNLYAYKNSAASAGNAPTNTQYWVLVIEGTDWRGTYTESTLYYVNDLVTDETSTFIVTTQHTSASPAGSLPNSNTTLLALGQEGLPNQASNANKVLSTDGTDALWTDTTNLTKTYTGNAQGSDAESFETSAALTDAVSVFSGSADGFVQFPLVNTSNGLAASTDFIAYTADGVNDHGWIDMGITSNNYDDATYGITGPHDGYLFMSAPQGDTYDVVSKKILAGTATLTTSLPHGYTSGSIVRVTGVGTAYDGKRTVLAAPSPTTFTFTTTGSPEAETGLDPAGLTWAPVGDGNLVLATSETGLQNKIVFAAGGLTAGNTQMEITPNTNVHIEIATESTSSTTGALTVNGGLGIAGNLFMEGDLDVNGDVDFSGVQHLPIGAGAVAFADTLTNPVITAVADSADYQQISFKNLNSGVNASTDFIAYSNNGTDNAGYIDMGITSSNFADPDFTITGKGDGYIFMVGAEGGNDQGNLVFATGDTGSQNKIVFAAGGLASDDTQMVITPGQNIHIEIPTESVSPTTGALTVVGGVGIQGDVNIQGNIVFGGEGTQVGTANLAVEAPFIFTGDESTSLTNDLGVVTEGKYIVSGFLPSRKVVNKSLTDNVATLTTEGDHGFLSGDSVLVAGIDATFNGTYTITNAPTTTTFTYAKTATNVASARIGDQTFSINNKLLVSEVATLTTTATHPYLVGETVVVTGVDSTFNGTYTITEVTSNTFSYAKPGSGNVSSTAVSPTGTSVVNQSVSSALVADPIRTRYNTWSKDSTDSTWKLASNIIIKPETTVDYGQEGIVYDAVRVGNLTAASGTFSSTITGGASSNIAINTDKFTVNATSGNTAISGTLAVTGATTLTGGISGALSATGDFAIATNKMTVASATGNTAIAGTLGVTGLTTASGGLTVPSGQTLTSSGTLTVSGGASFSGTVDLQEVREQLVEVSGTAPTLDWTAGNIYNWASTPGGNITANLTNVPTDNSKIMVVNLVVNQGGTAYTISAVNINGSAQTLRWLGGTAPTVTASKIDIFALTLIRTSGGAWQVLGSLAGNF